jgi:hypothetical protein
VLTKVTQQTYLSKIPKDKICFEVPKLNIPKMQKLSKLYCDSKKTHCLIEPHLRFGKLSLRLENDTKWLVLRMCKIIQTSSTENCILFRRSA